MIKSQKTSMKSAYVDFSVLNLLATEPPDSKIKTDYLAMNKIWELYNSHQIRLVTCGADTRMEIINWLETLGCYVTNTGMIKECLDDFEKWDQADTGQIQKCRNVLEYHEAIESLDLLFEEYAGDYGAGNGPAGISPGDRRLLSLIRYKILSFKKTDSYFECLSEDGQDIISHCLLNLNGWYGPDNWDVDFRRIDYKLNGKILVSALEKHGINTSFAGKEGAKNRRLFGILNRAVALARRFYRELPLKQQDVSGLMQEVAKRYDYHHAERDARHIFHAIRYGIPFFVTTDGRLIRGYNQRKHLLLNNPEYQSINLVLLTPKELMQQGRHVGEE